MNMKTRRSAFTLIELLVVISIIGMLAALLFPVFSRARESARRTGCLSNAKQILLALQLYQDDAEGFFPLNDPKSAAPQIWIDGLRAYARSEQIFVCPSDVEIEGKRERGFKPVGAQKHPGIPSSYVANEGLMSVSSGTLPASVRALGENEVAQPASTAFLSDGAREARPHPPYSSEERNGEDLIDDLSRLGYVLRDPSLATVGPQNINGFAPHPRHNGRSNVGFADGHVKNLAPTNWYFPQTPFLDATRGG